MPENCKEISSEIHFTEIDYVELPLDKLLWLCETPLGQVTLEILNPKNAQVSDADFIVIPNYFSCLLGLSTVQEMGLFTINKENFIAEVISDTSYW